MSQLVWRACATSHQLFISFISVHILFPSNRLPAPPPPQPSNHQTPNHQPPKRFPNVDKEVRKRLLQICFNFIPTTLTGQFLDSHDGPHGLMNVRHTFKYADPEVLGECEVPVLAINGDWDLFCPAAGGCLSVAGCASVGWGEGAELAGSRRGGQPKRGSERSQVLVASPHPKRNRHHVALYSLKGGKKTADLFAGPKESLCIGKKSGHCSHYGWVVGCVDGGISPTPSEKRSG